MSFAVSSPSCLAHFFGHHYIAIFHRNDPPLFPQVKNEERNRRNDLYVLANSYSGRLKGAKPNLMPETDFHIVPKRPQAAKVVNGASEKSSSTAANDVKSSGEMVEQNEKIVKVSLNIHICHISLV